MENDPHRLRILAQRERPRRPRLALQSSCDRAHFAFSDSIQFRRQLSHLRFHVKKKAVNDLWVNRTNN